MKQETTDYALVEIGVGLSQVDDLKPSKYLYEVLENSKNIEEVKSKLHRYYEQQTLVNEGEKECDLVAINTSKILSEKTFVFSPVQLKTIHKRLFKNIFDEKIVAGEFRKCNITKKEKIIDDRSVQYGDCDEIEEYLAFDYDREKRVKHSELSQKKQIENISSFISNIWQIHPFCEGNTRSIAIFTIKYLSKLGYKLNNEIFKEHSKYFRDALVLANHSDTLAKIDTNMKHLHTFFAKLIMDEKIELKKMTNPYKKFNN